LTREVFLPDQSAAHTKSSEKCWQVLSHEKSVEICACLWKKIPQQNHSTGKIGAVLIWSAGVRSRFLRMMTGKIAYFFLGRVAQSREVPHPSAAGFDFELLHRRELGSTTSEVSITCVHH
jgi:hypothetical protein